MADKLEPADMDEWELEFLLGIFSWMILPVYFAFITVVGVGIATKFIMGKTEQFMRKRYRSL